MKKVKERSEKQKNLRDKGAKTVSKKNVAILAVCVLVTVVAIFAFFNFLNSKNDENAIEFSATPGGSSTKVSRGFLNLLIADMKHNGISAQEDMVDYAVESACIYLESEYYCDEVYGVSLDEQQQNSIDEAINKLVEKHGSKKNLEKYLSGYGTNIEALRRYFELSLKQSNVLSFLERSVTLDQMKDYFADNYMSVDVVVVFDSEEKGDLVNDVYGMVKGGEITLEEARELYSNEQLKDYKAAYYISKTNIEGLDEELFGKIQSMREHEISVLDCGSFGYIIRRNPADTDAFVQNEDLYNGIRSAVKEQLYKSVCDAASEGISINESVIKKIDPSEISSLNISSLTDF